MQCERRLDLLPGRTSWVLTLPNRFDRGLTLLLSKVSEAVAPDTPGNHVGQGAAMDAFLDAQPGVRFVINGGFNHYRKSFYDWPHQDYQVGDPVGLVKIRHHVFDDVLDPRPYGFFVQQDKHRPWSIVPWERLDRSCKYILGCTPLLMLNGVSRPLQAEALAELPPGVVTPPSVLAHGLQQHPRTAVGLRDDELVFVVVEGGAENGCTLPELQQLGFALQLDNLLNLDGGGSSQFRLRTEQGWVRNFTEPQDAKRVLGNVIVLFDEALRSTSSNGSARFLAPTR